MDVATIEGEDEDVGCGRDVDSRITVSKGGLGCWSWSRSGRGAEARGARLQRGWDWGCPCGRYSSA